MGTTIKLFGDKMGGREAADYVGSNGDVFVDGKYGGLRLGDGMQAGGIQLGLETIPTVVDPAYAAYQSALAGWASHVQSIRDQINTNPNISEQGWSWVKWNVNGETVAGYLAQLTAAWTLQNTPASPPLTVADLTFRPAISSNMYQEIRSALLLVQSRYATYLTALEAKQISGTSLTVPEIVQTTADEDLVLRVRTSTVTSPPGGTAYDDQDFTFGANGSLTFPNGTTQTGASISKAELKAIVAASADFAAFKTAIAAL
jgi:hypothetical protein